MKREISITRPLMLALTGALIVFWLLAIGLGIQVMRHELDEVFDSALQETTERLLALIVDDAQFRDRVDTEQLSQVKTPGRHEYLTYQVRDPAGTVIFRSTDAQQQPFDAPLNTGFADTARHRIYTGASADGTLFLQVADRFSNRREAVRESAVTMLIPLVVLIPVSVFAIWLIVGRTLRPIDALRTAISTKDGGNMAPVESDMLPKELKPIARSVNLLLDRLRKAFDAEREFTANSAHELRTPIAGALAQTQRLIEELPDGHLKTRATNIELSLANLGRLAEKLMQLARADSGFGATTTSVNISQILDLIVLDFERDTRTGPRLRYNRGTGAPIMRRADIDAFGIVMRNLVENAVMHGDRDAPITISMATDGAITVTNDAEVVPATDLITLKTRFQRGKTDASGSGLGLSIADRIVTQMGGQLVLSSPPAGQRSGFEAKVILAA